MATTTARHKILAVLERRGTASAAQIGRTLNMSAAAVRHHLGILLEDGRITLHEAHKAAKRGRPEKIYKLSERMLGDNMAALAEAALSAWLGELEGAEAERATSTLGRRLAEEVGTVEVNAPPARRLVELTERLNARHYQARWEAGAQGPRVLFGHCPYAAIIVRHPELCAVDAAMLKEVMKTPFEQLSKIEAGPGGATHCVFAMKR